VHGTEKTHNDIVGMSDARERQEKFISLLRNKYNIPFRFNCVLSSYNQDELEDIVSYMIRYSPKIVNFINMNPHGDWGADREGTRKNIADLRNLEPHLNTAIQILESNGIGVNVRYYPMCRIAPDFRRCVCNDLHVTFDPYEWDYEIQPKSIFAFRYWGTTTSNNIERKSEPCKSCDLQWVCGGVNKAFFSACPEAVNAVKEPGIDQMDFMYYRKHNLRTLSEVI